LGRKDHNCSVPHPFDFVLSKGWETTNLNLRQPGEILYSA